LNIYLLTVHIFSAYNQGNARCAGGRLKKGDFKMKKILALTLAAAMSLSLAACGGGNGAASSKPAASSTPGSSDASASASGSPAGSGSAASGGYGDFTTVEPGKLIMSTEATFPPYEMIAENGEFVGIDVEVAGAIAKKLGLELVVDNMGFDAALTAAQTGQSDIAMAGITVNPERQEVMDFSDSYATGVQVVIVREDSPIQTIDDLANADMIGCQKATTGYIYCSAAPEDDGYGEDHVTAFDTGALAVMALVNNQIDAVVIDNEPAKSFVAANEGLKILDTEFAVEDYAIGVAKGNTGLLNAVNTAMAELKADGTFQQIVDKYITAE